MNKTVAPSIAETAFSCPHCGAFTTQFWYNLFANRYTDNGAPRIPKPSWKETLKNNRDLPPEQKEPLLKWLEKMLTGLVFFEHETESSYLNLGVQNLY